MQLDASVQNSTNTRIKTKFIAYQKIAHRSNNTGDPKPACLKLKGSVPFDSIIYTEVSVGFQRIEEVESFLDSNMFRRDSLPYHAGFLAGKAFLAYRRRGGTKTSVLPDFYIGAHAAVSKLTLLTRDTARYKTTYPARHELTPQQLLERIGATKGDC